MLSAWRLTKTKLLANAWDGQGARKSGGRWNSVGIAVVYTSGTLSLALVEVLVHIPSGILPAYSAVRVDFDESMVGTVERGQLPVNWRDHPPPPETKALGDRWVANGESAVLRVPSVVVPSEFNYVLNPSHPALADIHIGEPMPFPFDARLPMALGQTSVDLARL
jgi:RES domain-containing protein